MATTTARSSRDDRQGPPSRSPFRSKSDQTRHIAALEMITKRQQELLDLQGILASTKDVRTKRILSQRIRATKMNLDSWLSYLDGTNEKDEECYREPRAVIQPRRPRSKTRKAA